MGLPLVRANLCPRTKSVKLESPHQHSSQLCALGEAAPPQYTCFLICENSAYLKVIEGSRKFMFGDHLVQSLVLLCAGCSCGSVGACFVVSPQRGKGFLRTHLTWKWNHRVHHGG